MMFHEITDKTVSLPYFKQWQAFNPLRAGDWQREPDRLTHPVLDKLASLVGDDQVLDVGCGSAPDARLFKQGQYLGLDVTPRFVEVAHHDHEVQNILRGDGRYLPFQDDSVASVYCKDVLEHLPPEVLPMFIGELMRVASRQVFFIMFRPPTDKAEYIQREKFRLYSTRHGGVVEVAFWWNQYRMEDLTEVVEGYGGSVELFEVVDGVTPKHYNRALIQVIV